MNGRRLGHASGSCRAFTLIEALLATALMLVILVQLSQVQHSARVTLDRIRRPQGWSAELVRGYAQFAADCAQFQNPGFLEKGEAAITLTQVGGESTSGKLSIYAAEYLPAGAQDLRKVTYASQDGGLVRLSEPPRTIGTHLAPRTAFLASRASDVEFALYDGKVWTAQWGSRLGLPQGLRVCFTDQDGNRQEWERLLSGVMR